MKGNLLNGREYFQIIYLIRGLISKKYKEHNSLGQKTIHLKMELRQGAHL